MIDLKGIGKTYRMGKVDVPVLRDVSLKIEQGEYVAIMGQSGSGKSTLLHILGLLDRPDQGTFLFEGRDASRLDDESLAALRAEKIGFVFQQFHLLKRTTALDNVNLPLTYGESLPQSGEAERLLARVGLRDRIHHRPNELSGGQQQRVAIARSLVRHPGVLLADEPTGNLDSNSGREILELFSELNREGITVILVTHEPKVAEVARRVIRITDGRIESDERRVPEPVLGKQKEKAVLKEENSSWLPQALKMKSHFRQATTALLLNKMRTVLSALGIIIGVGAVITMLSLGKGAEKSISQQLSGLGSNRLVVRSDAQRIAGAVQQIGSVSRLTEAQADDIVKSVPTAKAVAPTVRGRVQVAWGIENANTEVAGTTPGYMEIYAAKPVAGRFFTEEENKNRERVALLGRTVAKNLFGEANPLGETIKINRVSFQVIGVLPARGASGPRDDDDVIVVPLQTAMRRLFGKNYVDSIDVAARDSASVDATQTGIRSLFDKWPKLPGSTGPSYRVDNLASVQAAFTAIISTLSMLLASIAAISLIVGGIGIMNIMLVSVTERTREIGLRKAVGGRNRDILMQFLVEAVTLCLGGGMAGILLGALLTFGVSLATGWSLGISVGSVILACGFSAGVGIIFGLWPAKKASLLNPIEALRHE